MAAALFGHARNLGDHSRLQIRQADPQTQRQVLGVLLTGRVRGSETAVEGFLAYARSQQLSLEQLWAAWAGTTPLAAALLAYSPGKTAMMFLSPVAHNQAMHTATELIRIVTQQQSPRQLRLVQVLLELGQRLEQRAFKQAGFHPLAELVYMDRRTLRQAAPLNLPGDVHVSTWSDQNRPLFEQAILASYEQTLDCPGLVGLRQIDDIIAGHMAVGYFDPRLWLVLHTDQQPVGVMLINAVPRRQAVELVYLGLSLPWRGRGLGRHLVSHGLWLGYDQQAAERMILAVDAQNTPAVGLYRAMQFKPDGRKLAMILPLP